MCNLQNIDLQNIPKMLTLNNLERCSSFDQKNKRKDDLKHFLCNYQILQVNNPIFHNLQNTDLQTAF